MVGEFSDQSGSSVLRVVDFLNTNTPEDSVIETYDSEILFLLDRDYHYPPDEVSVELMRRHDIDPNSPVYYDPIQADPDYLVVGPFSRKWRLYDEVLESNEFQSFKLIAPYEIFIRIHD